MADLESSQCISVQGGRKTEREIVQLAWQEWIEYKKEQEINAEGLTGRVRVDSSKSRNNKNQHKFFFAIRIVVR